MKITLVDCTGFSHPVPSLYAARLLVAVKNTRLENAFKSAQELDEAELLPELHYIAKTIRSSWEFIDFTFQIEGVTRAFTHQLVRTRTASFAQQSQRSVNMEDTLSVTIPEAIKNHPDLQTLNDWQDAINAIESSYKKLIKHGISPQDARGLLPTNIRTSILMKINLRNFADMIGKRQNLRAQGEYSEAVKLMADLVLLKMPWTYPFLYPDESRTPALEAILKERLGTKCPVEDKLLNDALKELDMLKGIH